MMHVSEIQHKTMIALRAVNAHILHSTVVALSSEPDDPNYDPTVKVNTFIVGCIMSKEAALIFRAAANLNNIWIKWTYWAVANDMEKFEYSITATEQRPTYRKLTIAITLLSCFALGLWLMR